MAGRSRSKASLAPGVASRSPFRLSNAMKKVLVADDRATSRELIRTVIEQCGHSVFEASDGREAVRTSREILPDLIILDLHMPILDGFEVLKALRSEQRF